MNPPSFTLTDSSGCESKKTIKFQCGLLRETETFMGEDLNVLCRDSLLDYACEMLNNKVTTGFSCRYFWPAVLAWLLVVFCLEASRKWLCCCICLAFLTVQLAFLSSGEHLV